MKKVFKLSNFDKFELIALAIEGVTGVAGVSVILTEKHPYLTIIILSVGAIASKTVNFIQKKKIQKEQELDEN